MYSGAAFLIQAYFDILKFDSLLLYVIGKFTFGSILEG